MGQGQGSAALDVIADPQSPTVVLISANGSDQAPSWVEACGAAALVDKRDFGPALLKDLWAAHGPR